MPPPNDSDFSVEYREWSDLPGRDRPSWLDAFRASQQLENQRRGLVNDRVNPIFQTGVVREESRRLTPAEEHNLAESSSFSATRANSGWLEPRVPSNPPIHSQRMNSDGRWISSMAATIDNYGLGVPLTSESVPESNKATKRNKKVMSLQLLDMEAEVKDGQMVIKMRANALVEEFFKTEGMGDINTSEKWVAPNGEGIQFYQKMVTLGDKVNKGNYTIIDNFGAALLERTGDGKYKLNVAPLRSVGVSRAPRGGSSRDFGGITFVVQGVIAMEDLQRYLDAVSDWLRVFYSSYLMRTSLRGSVSVDVE